MSVKDARLAHPRVLFYSLVFAPDGVSTAHIMSDLAEDLQTSGMPVSVVSTRPHQMRDTVAEARQPLGPKWGALLLSSSYRGIAVLHTWMPASRNSWVLRAVGWLSFHSVGLAAALFLAPRADVIIVPSPLLSAGLVAWLITVVRGGSFIYNVQEVYPELAIRLGYLKNPLLIGLLRWLERFVYARAGAVTVIGPAMRRAVLDAGADESKVRLIPNFVDLSAIKTAPRSNAFGEEYGLSDKFVVSYAGNMGRAQGLNRLLDAAERMLENPTVLFLFVGDGVLREPLEQEASARGLVNVRFVPHQPFTRVPEIYGASDVCVIPMLGAITAEAIPSKVYRIMAAQRPILAMTTLDSDLGMLVTETDAGIVVDSPVPDALIEGILDLQGDPARLRDMGARGREYVEKRHGRGTITRAYGELIQAVAGGNVQASSG